LVSLGLEARQMLGVKVRQPLAAAKLRGQELIGQTAHQRLLADELNVKKIYFDQTLDEDLWLDPEISDGLRDEGLIRELVRQIQEERKRRGLKLTASIKLTIDTGQAGRVIVRRFETELQSGVGAQAIDYAPLSTGLAVRVGELDFRFELKVI